MKKMSTANARITIDGKESDRDVSDMDIVHITDRGGKTIRMQMFDGKHYAACYKPSDMKGMRTFQLRSDDVYFPAFPRTGTHWSFEIVCMLLKGKAETIPTSKSLHQLEIASAEDLGNMSSPRVLNTHMRLSDAPEQLVEKKCKIIYNLRDPKDVAVSLYNFSIDAPMFYNYQGEFKDYLHLFLDGKVECNGIFGHFRDAEKFFDDHPNIPVHIQVYEETSKHPLTEVQQLSDFLGLERNEALCQAIAEKCEFSRMKEDKDAYCNNFDGRNILYRKGVVGDWKNWFTDEMLEDYYRAYEEKMAGSRFYERYSSDKYEN